MAKPVQRESRNEFLERIGKMTQTELQETISKMTPEQLQSWFDRMTSEVGVEPVYGGCKHPCPQCVYEGDRPETAVFLEVSKLKKTLRKMQRKGMQPKRFYYALRGESAYHPELSSITAAIKKAYPESFIEFYWGLQGIGSREELEEKTRGGLGLLRLSLDDHHLSCVVKELKAAGEKKKVREKAIQEVKRRLDWVKSAAEKNGFAIGLRLTGSQAECDRWSGLVKQAGIDVKPEHAVQGERQPPGNEVGRFFFHFGMEGRAILHDGSLVTKLPEPRKTAVK